jgi:hypothetical protein
MSPFPLRDLAQKFFSVIFPPPPPMSSERKDQIVYNIIDRVKYLPYFVEQTYKKINLNKKRDYILIELENEDFKNFIYESAHLANYCLSDVETDLRRDIFILEQCLRMRESAAKARESYSGKRRYLPVPPEGALNAFFYPVKEVKAALAALKGESPDPDAGPGPE